MRIYVFSHCISEFQCKSNFFFSKEKKGNITMICYYLSVAVGLFCLLCKQAGLTTGFGKYSSAVSSGTTALQETYFEKC